MSETIDLNLLSDQVVEILEDAGNVIPKDSPALIKQIGSYFNDCIKLNEASEPTKSIVIPAKTGTSKSLTTQVYTSMLKETASIVVVKDTADAIEYSEQINKFRTDPNYSRCYYNISSKEDHPMRVNKDKLQEYQCIVITHSMFIRANKDDQVSEFIMFRGAKRDLVVIDERINLLDKTTINVKEIERLNEFVTNINKTIFPSPLKTFGSIVGLDILEDIIFDLNHEASSSEIKSACTKEIEHSAIKRLVNILGDLLTAIKSNPEEYKKLYFNDPIFNIALNVSDKEFVAGIEDLILRIRTLLNQGFSIHTTYHGKVITSAQYISIQFGSNVILDATANIHAKYLASQSIRKDEIEVIKVTNPRIYKSLTIYKCNGTNQSKSHILDPTKLKNNTKYYVDAIRSTLDSPTDKLLVVTFDSFINHLKKHITDSRVQYTNYGNHIGKNNWKDCNKVIIIGWFRIPKEEHLYDVIAQAGENVFNYDDISEVESRYELTGIVDDLVQASMRGSARITDNINGDCKASSIYLFYDNSPNSKEIIDMYTKEFSQAIIKEWEPTTAIKPKRSSKQENISRITKYIENKRNENIETIPRIEIVDILNIKSGL